MCNIDNNGTIKSENRFNKNSFGNFSEFISQIYFQYLDMYSFIAILPRERKSIVESSVHIRQS